MSQTAPRKARGSPWVTSPTQGSNVVLRCKELMPLQGGEEGSVQGAADRRGDAPQPRCPRRTGDARKAEGPGG